MSKRCLLSVWCDDVRNDTWNLVHEGKLRDDCVRSAGDEPPFEVIFFSLRPGNWP
jgi:hypothetical protein